MPYLRFSSCEEVEIKTNPFDVHVNSEHLLPLTIVRLFREINILKSKVIYHLPVTVRKRKRND